MLTINLTKSVGLVVLAWWLIFAGRTQGPFKDQATCESVRKYLTREALGAVVSPCFEGEYQRDFR